MKKFGLIGFVAIALAAGCSKPNADALLAKGNDYMDKKLVAEAIVQYRLAEQADPKRGDVRTKLSDAYLQQRDLRGALKEALSAAELLPKDAKAQVKAGNYLLMANAFEDAKARAEAALAIDANDPDAMVLMGNALAGLKDLDGAVNEYEEALALNPSGDQAYANIGAIQASRGQTKEAEATFRKAVDVAPKSVSARLALASFLWSSKRPAEAETALKEALALDPSNLATNRALGAFYISSGRGPEAEPYFKAIVATAKTDETQLALADYYLAMGRADDAKAILTPLLQKTEPFGPASLRLAAIEVGRNNRGVAATIVRSVLDKTPKYAPARVFQLRLLVLDNKLDEAMVAADALIKDEPNGAAAAEAQLVVGGIEASRDRTEDAIRAFSEALKIQPKALAPTVGLARLYLATGRIDKAEAYIKQALEDQPTSGLARSLMVRLDFARNDVAKANAELASLQKDFPGSPTVLNLVAMGAMVGKRPDAARTAYERVMASMPGDLEALEGLTGIDLRAGKKKEAVDRIDATLKKTAPSAALYVLAARTYAATGDMKRAEELLRSAIEAEPTRLAAYGLLGQLYVNQKRLPDAKDQFQEIVKRNPRSVTANTILAMILEAQNDPGTEAQYLKTLEIDPSAAVAANNLAWIYVASNRNLDQALQLAQTALKSLPEEPHVNDTAGWIYYRKGLFSQAVPPLELSAKRDATEPAVFYHLGMAYVETGEIEKARTALKKALAMSQTFDGAAEAKKTLQDISR